MSPIILVIIYMIAFFIVLMIYLRVSDYLNLRTTLGYIPGPKSFPFIGLSWQAAKISPEDRFRWFNNLCFEYRTGMVVTWFGTQPFVNIRKPEQLKIILQGSFFISKSKHFNVLTPWLDGGLLTLTGMTWFYHRSLLSPPFESNAVIKHFSTIRRIAERLTKQIDGEQRKNPIAPLDIFAIITKYTLDIISKVVTGENMNINQIPPSKYVEAFYRIYRIAAEKSFQQGTKWDPYFSNTQFVKDYKNAVKSIQDFIEEVIKERKLKLSEDKVTRRDTEETEERKDFETCLDEILDTNDNSEDPITFEEIRQETETLVFSGHDTITVAVTWALFVLGNHEDAQIKVHEEIRNVFKDSQELVSVDQINELIYLDRVIMEVLRLYPSIPTIARCLENHAVIDNYFVPRGTIVNLQIYQLHHDPETWSDPEYFDPDRFLPENSQGRHPYAYIPFSAGLRNCVGQKLAMLEIKIILVAILRKWQVVSLYKPYEVKMKADYLLRSSNNKTELFFKRLKDT